MNMERVGLLLFSSQLAAQVFVVHPQTELIGVGGIVPDAVVDVVVRYAGACPEGNLTAEVWKQVQPVVVMVLCDGQLFTKQFPSHRSFSSEG